MNRRGSDDASGPGLARKGETAQYTGRRLWVLQPSFKGARRGEISDFDNGHYV